jgi:tetratricopeptide (TPR) repeat protein
MMLLLGLASGRPSPLVQAPAKDPEPANQKGDDLFKAGKYHEAIQAYKDALGKDPNNDHAMEFTILSYNKIGDREQARSWMRRRLEIPAQTPSIKARVLTDLALLYWDEARNDLLRAFASGDKLKPEDAATIGKLVADGTDSAQKAAAIAPRSAKAFNLLNLLNRVQADVEQDSSKQKELISRADEALRHSIEFYEGSTQQQQSHDVFTAPTVSLWAGKNPGGVKIGQATKQAMPDAVKNAKEGPVSVEIMVGMNGKVLWPRLINAPGKTGEAVVAAARQWEFEPSTFEGHNVQVIEVISFPLK